MRFQPTLRGLGVTHTVHLRLIWSS